MEHNNYFKTLFVVTLIVALLLAVFLLYTLWIRPSFQGYVIQKQFEAKDLTLMALVSQIQQQGYAQITFGNQTLFLAPFNPQASQQQAQQQIAQPVE